VIRVVESDGSPALGKIGRPLRMVKESFNAHGHSAGSRRNVRRMNDGDSCLPAFAVISEKDGIAWAAGIGGALKMSLVIVVIDSLACWLAVFTEGRLEQQAGRTVD